jgi:hypothetical protein
MKVESRMADARDWKEGKMGTCYSMGIKFQLCMMYNF